MGNLEELERVLGYSFQDKQLLIDALTHSTYANLHGGNNNERLEYFGDAILQFIITEQQYRLSLDDEGALTKRRQSVVCEDALLKAVEKMGLGKWLRFEGEYRQNVSKKTLSSLYESVLAAIYLDGGLAAAKAFVEKYPTTGNRTINYKSELQEFLQAQGEPLPVYETTGESGAFTSKVYALGKVGAGSAEVSKRAAEQGAAKDLLEQLKKAK